MGSFYPRWSHQLRISVANPPSTSGYQVQVEIPWYPGMKDDFSDLRFSDYSRTLPYWIETYTSRSTATVWVKLTETGEAARDFLCYYGNSGADSESNGDNVFEFYDDASTDKSSSYATVNLNSSALNCSYSYDSGNKRYNFNLTGSDHAGLVVNGVTIGDAEIRVKILTRSSITANYQIGTVMRYSSSGVYYGRSGDIGSNFVSEEREDSPPDSTPSSFGSTIDGPHDIVASTYYTLKGKSVGSTHHYSSSSGDDYEGTDATYSSGKWGVFAGYAAASPVLYLYQTILRKAQATEPTCTVSYPNVNPSYFGLAYGVLYKTELYPHDLFMPDHLYLLWKHRARVSITNPPSVTGYQVAVTVPWQPGMNDDFSDIRFADYLRVLPYWIESYTARSTATVWVKLTETGQAAKDIFLYYGNDQAVSESNGENVFLLFDHFEGTTIDTKKWTLNPGGTAGISVSNSVLTIDSIGGGGDGGEISSKLLFNSKVYEAYLKPTSNTSAGEDLMLGFKLSPGDIGVTFWNESTSTGYLQAFRANGSNWAWIDNIGSKSWNGAYHKFRIFWNGTTRTDWWIDTTNVNATNYLPTQNCRAWIRALNEQKVEVDYIFIREFASTEPSTAISEYGINPGYYRVSLLPLLLELAPHDLFLADHLYPLWPHKVRVSVTNPPTVTDYQVSLTVAWRPGMNDDFSDLRFADYYQPLSYWIESYTARTTATVWIKMKETGQAAKDIFLYYGNGQATSESNGDNTFDFFDHFEGTSLNMEKWSYTGFVTVSNSIAEISASISGSFQSLISRMRFGQNYRLIGRVKDSHSGKISGHWSRWGWDSGDGSHSIFAFWVEYYSSNTPPIFQTFHTPSFGTEYPFTGSAGTFYIHDFMRNGVTNVKFTLNGGQSKTESSIIPDGDMGIMFQNRYDSGSSNILYVDWVAIGKYSSTEPTLTLAEQVINPAYPIAKAAILGIYAFILDAYQDGTSIKIGWS